MDQTHRQLAARFDAISNREDDSDWHAVVQRATERETSKRSVAAPDSGSRRRLSSRSALVAAAVIVVGALAAVVVYERLESGSSTTRPAAPRAQPESRPPAHKHVVSLAHPTRVATLAFTHRRNAVGASDLPASVTEVVTQMGADPASAQEPFTGPPSIYLFHRGSNNLCLVIALGHAVGSCFYVLNAAAGAISDPTIAIVDGKLFVAGLVANDARTITATVTGADKKRPSRSAVIKNNVFAVSLPYNGGGVDAITVTVNRTDGTSQSFDMPGVPAPMP